MLRCCCCYRAPSYRLCVCRCRRCCFWSWRLCFRWRGRSPPRAPQQTRRPNPAPRAPRPPPPPPSRRRRRARRPGSAGGSGTARAGPRSSPEAAGACPVLAVALLHAAVVAAAAAAAAVVAAAAAVVAAAAAVVAAAAAAGPCHSRAEAWVACHLQSARPAARPARCPVQALQPPPLGPARTRAARRLRGPLGPAGCLYLAAPLREPLPLRPPTAWKESGGWSVWGEGQPCSTPDATQSANAAKTAAPPRRQRRRTGIGPPERAQQPGQLAVFHRRRRDRGLDARSGLRSGEGRRGAPGRIASQHASVRAPTHVARRVLPGPHLVQSAGEALQRLRHGGVRHAPRRSGRAGPVTHGSGCLVLIRTAETLCQRLPARKRVVQIGFFGAVQHDVIKGFSLPVSKSATIGCRFAAGLRVRSPPAAWRPAWRPPPGGWRPARSQARLAAAQAIPAERPVLQLVVAAGRAPTAPALPATSGPVRLPLGQTSHRLCGDLLPTTFSGAPTRIQSVYGNHRNLPARQTSSASGSCSARRPWARRHWAPQSGPRDGVPGRKLAGYGMLLFHGCGAAGGEGGGCREAIWGSRRGRGGYSGNA